MSSELKIAGAHDSFECPGKITTPRNLRTHCAYAEDSDLPPCEFTDSSFDPVTLTMGVLQLGEVVFVTTDANVVPALWRKLRQVSPLAHTMVVATNFGPLRHVVDDAAYPLRTYEATDTRAQMGCAEQGFLSRALSLIDQTQ